MELPFGYAYDERMLLHDCGYDSTMAEKPERMKLIYERLCSDGFLRDAIKIAARPATDAELLTNHPQELLSELQELKTSEECEEYCRDKEVLWLSPQSEQAARLAAGVSIDIIKANIDKKIGNGFALVRPPGHHSYGKLPQGYCVFNNIAIAAKVAIQNYKVRKIAIVDFDYHAGNGTFYSVKEEENILFISLHSYCYGSFWPFTKEMDFSTKSKNTIFVPLNGAMNTEIDFMAAFQHVILPIIKEWGPEMILISAGFDSGYYDIMLEFGQAVKAHGFGHIARALDQITPNRVIAILEGGYFPKNYVESASMMVRGLQGLPLPMLDYTIPVAGTMVDTLWNNIIHHSKNYICMQEKLHLLLEQQKQFGLLPYVQQNPIFLGTEMRQMYDKVKSCRAVRTREWFPEMPPEFVEESNRKIEEYIQKYQFESSVTKEEFDLHYQLLQLLWTDEKRSDWFIKSSFIAHIFLLEFKDFVEGRTDHTMICDRQLYDIEKNEKICGSV